MKSRRHILLVEPPYQRKIPPLSLMKFSTFHKQQGNKVKYIRGESAWFDTSIIKFNPDKIYVTSVFTWDFPVVVSTINNFKQQFPEANIVVGGILASLFPDQIEKKTGIRSHIGLVKYAEDCAPDYSLFPELDYSIATTTRGCIRKCKFCMVSRLEPKFIVKENWKNQIALSKPKIQFQDNNFLVAPEEHIDDVLNFCRRHRKSYDFNQAIDARLFDKKMAKKFSKTMIRPIRFSWDGPQEDNDVVRVIKLCQKYGINNIMIFALYNFKDKPEYMWYRIHECLKAGRSQTVRVYPMLYRDINTLKPKESVGNGHWTTKMIKNFRRRLGGHKPYYGGFLMPLGDNQKWFYKQFGKSEEEFIDFMQKKKFPRMKVKRESSVNFEEGDW